MFFPPFQQSREKQTADIPSFKFFFHFPPPVIPRMYLWRNQGQPAFRNHPSAPPSAAQRHRQRPAPLRLPTASGYIAGFGHKAWNLYPGVGGVTSCMAENVVSSEAGSVATASEKVTANYAAS